ncbi:MAG: SDR family NAD-dependent epimerase/dehydratase [Sphingobacteriales bacterium]|nr:MAG: SDR family NAD-dependent epimerase/dehydratase [Sphingobacteriales bacterium]
MNVLITGGAGYIGSELAKRLAKNNSVSRTTVYDNLSRGNHNFFIGDSISGNKIHFVNGDILDSRKLKKVLKGCDAVIHLAAKVTTPFSNIDSHAFEQVNHWGTAELVYALEEQPVSQFIFMSSASVYGNITGEATEETIPNPSSFYGVSKFRAEQHVMRLMEKMNTIILRAGNVYGFSQSMRFDAVINKFMFDAHFHDRVTIHGNGKQLRTFIHIDKVTYMLEQLLSKKTTSGVYNLSDKNLSVIELIDTLKIFYPELEFMFINQHLNMQQMIVNSHSKLYSEIPLPTSELSDELKLFKERFAF